MKTELQQTARVFKALGDENRLQILKLLHSGEKCACVLLEDLHISQSTLSHHMKILCDAGIVNGRKDGKWVHYSIDEEGTDFITSVVEQNITAPLHSKKACACKKAG